MTVSTLGPAPIGTSGFQPRVNTQSPYDLAYWSLTFLSLGSSSDYFDDGPETDGVSLLTWCASQVGIVMPDSYSGTVSALQGSLIPVSQALRMRGALVYSSEKVCVCLGLGDVVDVVGGRYFIVRHSGEAWTAGALVPGMDYR